MRGIGSATALWAIANSLESEKYAQKERRESGQDRLVFI